MFSTKLLSARACRRLLQCVKCPGKRGSVIRARYASSTAGSSATHAAEEVQEKSVTLKPGVKPGTNFPIAKRLFMGDFDKECLVFPEITSNEELDELMQMVEPVERFMEEVDSTSIDENAKIPDEVLQQLKDFGLFGQQIPIEYGGLGLNATKYARLAEVTGVDGSIAVTLTAHQAIGLKGILLEGTPEQKAKYLPKLATGEHIAAFCLTEPSSGSDAASVQATATLSEDGKTYYLNGGKIWISNGGIADVFTVFARTAAESEWGEKGHTLTAFIVERNFGGVTSGKPEDKLGIRGSNTCEVHFDNTPIPAENVLGGCGSGFKVAMNVLNSGRFTMGCAAAGAVKKLISLAADHAITRSQFGKKIKDFSLIQDKFTYMAQTVYAMESMAYFTAGILDGYEEPDASVEAAMVKVFSSEGCWRCINDCLQVMGGMGYMKGYPYERYLRDGRIMLIFEGTNEILRLFIALTSIQYCGNELAGDVIKMANPYNNVGFMMQKSMERLRRKNPKLSMKLYDQVHPNLSRSAEAMEIQIHKFKLVVEDQLTMYKNDILEEQLVLKRLADIAIDLYAMTACMSRASRSMCIGLRNADHEVLLAQQFCLEADRRIENNMLQLSQGKFGSGDENNRLIAEDIFKHGGYCAEHPLTRNW